MDINGWLVVCCSWEDLWLRCWNCSVAVDEFCEHSTHCFDTKWQWSYIKKDNVFDITSDNTTLDSSTHSNYFIRVNWFIWFFTSFSFNSFYNGRNTSWTTDKDDFVDIWQAQTCIWKGLTNWSFCTFYKITSQIVEFRTSQGHFQVKRSSSSCSDERQADLSWSHTRKVFLRFFSCVFQTLKRHLVCWQVDTVFFLEFFNHVVDDFLVKVITTEFVIPCSCQYIKDTITKFKDRYVECTTTKVEYQDFFFFISLIQTISKGCCCWFVDDTFYFKTSDFTSVFSCLTLRIVEVSWNCDNSFGYFFTKVIFSITFQVLKNHSWDFLWCVFFTVGRNLFRSTHLRFDRDHCIWVCNCLTFCSVTNDDFTVFEWHNRWSCTVSFWVCDDFWFSSFKNCYCWVCCT